MFNRSPFLLGLSVIVLGLTFVISGLFPSALIPAKPVIIDDTSDSPLVVSEPVPTSLPEITSTSSEAVQPAVVLPEAGQASVAEVEVASTAANQEAAYMDNPTQLRDQIWSVVAAPVADVDLAELFRAPVREVSVVEEDLLQAEAQLQVESAAPVVVEADLVFDQFFSQVVDGKTHLPTGVYVQDSLALPVIQQPTGDAAFVSTENNVITQFSSAAKQGVTGLLAHNYLSGELFYNLVQGQEVRVVYGDGTIKLYRIASIEKFQRLDFTRLNGNFTELSTGKTLTSNEVFSRYYSGSDHVTFQTCLERNGKPNWGLVFIVATPIIDRLPN